MKKRRNHILTGLLILLAILIAGSIGYLMGSRKTPVSERTFYATVETIGSNDLTIQGLEINDINSRHKFHLTLDEHTRMEWNHTPITLSDLKPGSRVSITYTGEIAESDPAQIQSVTKIQLLEDTLDHAPRLVFREAHITAMASLAGYGSFSSTELSYEDICELWNVKSLPGLSDIEGNTPWSGYVEFYEDGSIAVIELNIYNTAFEMANGILLCHLSICPGKLPLQSTYFNDETPTCTLWDTPVVALETGTTYQGSETMATTPYESMYLRFMTNGPEAVGVEGKFYAPYGKLEQTKALMNTITGYFLDPQNNISLDAIDSSDIYTLGLYDKLCEESLKTLVNPVFAVEDLTQDLINGRIFEKYENYFAHPYLQFSVLYPDNTIIEFAGHWDPKDLYKQFTNLPIS